MKKTFWYCIMPAIVLLLAACADLGQENAPDNGIAPSGSHSPGFGGPDPYGPGGPPPFKAQ